jgi:hypothetical protein
MKVFLPLTILADMMEEVVEEDGWYFPFETA